MLKLATFAAKNEMVVNSHKFQAIILNRKETQATYKLIIDNKQIKTINSIKLLCINIDDQLKFNEHIFQYCVNIDDQLKFNEHIFQYCVLKQQCS